jgi:hypothetical protein
MSQSFADALSLVPKSRGLATTLARAYDYARTQAHRAVTLEHLLLALIADGDASRVLQACSVDLARLSADASNYLLGLVDPVLPEHAGEPGIDPTLIRILDYASAAAQQSRRPEVNGAIVLAAIVGDGSSAAAAILGAQGLTFEEAIKALQRTTGAADRVAASPVAVPTPAQAASSNRPVPPPIAPQAMPAPPSRPPGERGSPKSLPEAAAADPLNGDYASTEEILAGARRRVDAGRRSVAMPPASAAPGQGQPGSHLEPHIEPWPEPEPMAQSSGLREPRASAGPDQDPPVGSDDRAQPIAKPAAAEVAAAAATFSEARDGDASSPVPASDQAPEAKSSSRPGAAATQIAMNQSFFPSASEPLAHPHAVAPPGPVAARAGPPPLRPKAESPSARLLPPSHAASPEHGELSSQSVYAPWPGQVATSESAPDPRRDFAFDGDIAGAPYFSTDEPAFTRAPAAAAALRRIPASALPRQAAAPPPGRLIENLPRTIRVGKPRTIEVRIAKASVQALGADLQSGGTAYPHDVIITKAISVRLRAPEGGFCIEIVSPETQWIDGTLDPLTDNFASWRWTVTAQRRGRHRLQLVISARTVGADGLATETALQNQIVEVRVRTNYGHVAARWGGWIAAAMVGGVLARFGEGMWNAGLAALDRLSGI